MSTQFLQASFSLHGEDRILCIPTSLVCAISSVPEVVRKSEVQNAAFGFALQVWPCTFSDLPPPSVTKRMLEVLDAAMRLELLAGESFDGVSDPSEYIESYVGDSAVAFIAPGGPITFRFIPFPV